MDETGDRRQHLIEAASRTLAERGYEATSIKDIAHAAGVAPGLIHYYFASKEELLIAVLREASDRYTKEMQHVRNTIAAEQVATVGLREPRRRTEQEPEWYRLRYDLFAMGLRRPTIGAGVAALLAGGRAGIASLVLRAMGGNAPGADPDALAAVLIACFDGLALQYLVDPTFDLDAAYQTLERMVAPLIVTS